MVQYVLVRRDLQSVLGWPLGSVVAQVRHVCGDARQRREGQDWARASSATLADPRLTGSARCLFCVVARTGVSCGDKIAVGIQG